MSFGRKWVGVLAAVTLCLAPLPLIADRPLQRPDAIVVLASHEWERIPAAADLAQAHPNAAVVLTVFREFSELSCHLCGERPRWLNHLGVDGRRIVEVELGKEGGTWGEALAITAEARRRGWRRLLVVTSAYHTRRAFWTFRKAAGDGVEIGVASAQAHSRLRPALWWASLDHTWYVGREWAALGKYAVMGRLAP